MCMIMVNTDQIENPVSRNFEKKKNSASLKLLPDPDGQV